MLYRRFVRYTFVVLLIYAFFVAFTVVFTTFKDGVRYLRNQKNDLGLDFDASFQEKFQKLMNIKLDSDLDNHFWALRKDRPPTTFSIPKKGEKAEKGKEESTDKSAGEKNKEKTLTTDDKTINEKTNSKSNEKNNEKSNSNEKINEKIKDKNDNRNDLRTKNKRDNVKQTKIQDSNGFSRLRDMPSFDPRRTIATYMHWLSYNLAPKDGVDFHWADWVDMLRLAKIAGQESRCDRLFSLTDGEKKDSNRLQKVESFCSQDDSKELGFRITRASGQNLIAHHQIIGRSYLFSEFANPQKIVFLTDDRLVEVKVRNQESKLDHSIMNNGMLDAMSGDLDVVKKYQNYMRLIGTVKNEDLAGEIVLTEADFEVDATKEVAQYAKENPVYSQNVAGLLAMDNPPKHFYEASLLTLSRDNWQGEHYDWRFFLELIIGLSSQTLVLHRLIKNWLHFTRQNNIRTWVGHGTLLSWHWNSLLFPWDTDADVQMPILDLYRLGREFNQLLVVERVATPEGEFDGMGRYFVDVSLSISHRTRGNGNNNIDARFIDVDTGLYIDITGLSVSKTEPPHRYKDKEEKKSKREEEMEKREDNENQEEVNLIEKREEWDSFNRGKHLYNCRNNHFVRLDEVSPLRIGVMEGQIGYFPRQYEKLLGVEYLNASLTRWNHGDYYFDDNLRNWIFTQDVLDYMEDPSAFVADFNMELLSGTEVLGLLRRIVGDYERFKLRSLKPNDYLNLLTDDKIFEEYVTTKGATLLHMQKPENHTDYALALARSGAVGKALRNDLFMDKLMRKF